jgi:hypothetical protein
MKSEDTASATSSPDSGAGHWLADSPALTQGFLFGPPASRASRSRKRGPARRKKTTDTSGPISFASSASAALSASLANRLLERRVIGGSTEYDLRWKRLVTPSGLVLYRLLPQARRTAACDTSGVPSGWPTATVRDEKGREGQPSKASLEGSGHGRQVLAEAAHLTEPPAPWPTPGAMETSREEGMRPSRAATGRKVGYLSEAVVSYGAPAPWQTPTVVDLTGRPYTYPSGDHSRPFLTLPGQAALTDAPSPWASPAVRDIKDTSELPPRAEGTGVFETRTDQLARQAFLTKGAPGTTAGSSSAATESTAAFRLNPAFSLWLMGYLFARPTPGWLSCSPGYEAWVTVQRLLSLSSSEPEPSAKVP